MSLSIQPHIPTGTSLVDLLNTQTTSSPAGATSTGLDAGSTLAETLDAQVSGLGQTQSNAQDAISLLRTGEGALAEVQSMLQGVRDLAIAYNSGSLSSTEESAVANEVAQICQEISQIADQTQSGGISLFTGGATITLQAGAAAGETVSVNGAQLLGNGPGYDIDSSIFNFSGGSVNLASIDAAISNVSTARHELGSVQRLFDSSLENLEAAGSSVDDLGTASQLAGFTSLQVVEQAGTASSAQANTSPQSVIQLLQ